MMQASYGACSGSDWSAVLGSDFSGEEAHLGTAGHSDEDRSKMASSLAYTIINGQPWGTRELREEILITG